MRTIPAHIVIAPILALSICTSVAFSQDEPQLTVEEQMHFLLTAKIIADKGAPKGITAPRRLTLSDGNITHDAAFQTVNERKAIFRGESGRTEMNFVDSYRYNLAAWELADLLGLADMMPATVERKWKGKKGSLSWWVPTLMDEAERLRKKVEPPDVEAWNQQMYLMRVFSQLVYDTDRNLGNVLIGRDWKLYMIDFTRAFRLFHDLENPKNLVKCSRALLESLRRLDAARVAERAGRYLSKPEIQGVMKRRDRIVAVFDKLISERGETEVLF